jgi:hypothetical protein
MTTVTSVIKTHDLFLNQVLLENAFLHAYKHNQKQFHLLFSEDLKIELKYSGTCPDYVAESIGDICYAIVHKEHHFAIRDNGIFDYLGMSNRRSATYTDIMEWIVQHKENWGI